MTWEDLLKRDDIVGGDIETQESGYVFRGPIESISIKDDYFEVKTSWMAQLRRDEWSKWPTNSIGVSTSHSTPIDIGEGRIFFNIPFIGVCTIFPKGGSKLDPAKVKGL